MTHVIADLVLDHIVVKSDWNIFDIHKVLSVSKTWHTQLASCQTQAQRFFKIPANPERVHFDWRKFNGYLFAMIAGDLKFPTLIDAIDRFEFFNQDTKLNVWKDHSTHLYFFQLAVSFKTQVPSSYIACLSATTYCLVLYTATKNFIPPIPEMSVGASNQGRTMYQHNRAIEIYEHLNAFCKSFFRMIKAANREEMPYFNWFVSKFHKIGKKLHRITLSSRRWELS